MNLEDGESLSEECDMRSYCKLIQVIITSSLAIVMSCALSIAHAQGTATGSIQGTIVDISGSSIPGARIAVTSSGTNATQTFVTHDDGGYSFPNLAIGVYTIKVEKSGFDTEVQQNVNVAVGQTTFVDIKMPPGQQVQTVNVEAQAQMITEDRGDRSVLLQEQTLANLPLQVSSGPRLDDTFLTLAPGVTGNTFAARINGAPDFSQDFYYDGIPYMNADGGGRQEALSPPVDSIDEYSIVTNAYSAANGRSSGLLNFHIVSGTNRLHGGGWEYLRNNVLDSKGYFSPNAGTEKQHEFGFKVGGPVYIPKLYNGRDKTFFFFLMDWYKFRGGVSTSLTTLPTSRMKMGDFSELPFPIYDPATTRPDGSGGLTRDPFPNNMIPTDRLSANSASYLSLIPEATLPGIVNNAVVKAPASPVNNKYWLVKIDHNITPRFVLHGSYYHINSTSPTSPQFSGPLGSGNNFFGKVWEPRLSLDQNISSHVYNQTGFSWQYTEGVRIFFPLVPSGFNGAFSKPGLPYPALAIQGMPTFGTGLDNNQNSGGCWPCIFFADNFKYQLGRHALSAGTEIRAEDERDAFAVNIGTFSFGNGTTSLPDSPNFGSLGYGFASFYLGTLNTASRTGAANNRLVRTGYRAFYIQDDIKVNSKLTVNAGLRWDVAIPVTDTHTQQFSSFDPTVPNPGAGGLPGSLVYTGRSGGPCIPQGGASICRSQIADTYYGSWQPRIGFAYRVGDKTVVRGGFGQASLRGGASTLMGPEIAAGFLTGFQYQDTLTSPDNGISPPPQLRPSWDVGLPPVGSAPPRTRDLANNQPVDYMQKIDGKNGYTMNWSLTVERELPAKIAFESSYVGSSSVRIGGNLLNENQVPSSYLGLGPVLNDDINSPAAAAAGITPPFAGFTGSVSQALRPFPQFLTITAKTQTPGHSNYHSLQLRAQKAYSDGVTFLVSYTWSKNLLNGLSQFSTFSAMPLDTAQRSREKQVLGATANGGGGPHVLSIATTYELPIGPGKKYLNSGVVSRLTGGWGASGVFTYNAGAALPISGGSPNPIFNGQSRPNLVTGVPQKLSWSGKFNPFIDRYLNPAAFSDAGPFALGNAPPALPRTRAFAYYNENISAIKNTKIWERASLQFRADFFNAFNRVAFGTPDTNFNDVTNGGFGKISSQANSPRVIQFGLRVDF
jgi:hypothetical protein